MKKELIIAPDSSIDFIYLSDEVIHHGNTNQQSSMASRP
jgi:hypothetical protein